MKLYYSPGACSLAPHIILRETGADFTLERVDAKTKKTETGADYLAINPKGYVPALELDDGALLTEGIIIQQLLADRAADARLAPARGTTERLQLEELLVFITTELHKAHSPLFAPTTPEEFKTTQREKIGARYDLIERQLADGRRYLTGEQFTIADAYLFVIAGWAQPTGVDLSNHPNIRALVARIGERPAVQAARQAEGLKQAA